MFNILWIIFLFTQMQALCAHRTQYRVLENPLKTYMCAFFFLRKPACISNARYSKLLHFSMKLKVVLLSSVSAWIYLACSVT